MEDNEKAENYDKINFLLIIIFSLLSLLIYIVYLSIIITYIIKYYHTKKLSIFWINYCYLIFTGMIFIISYIINLLFNNFTRIDNINDLSNDFFVNIIMLSLTFMISTIIGSFLFDAITAFKLSSKINEIKRIIETELLAVSDKFKNINITNILKMKYTCKYYTIFSLINIILIVLCFLSYRFTNNNNYNNILNFSFFFAYLIRYYHLFSFILLIISIIYMNKCKKSLLNKQYYNNNRIVQKVYDAHFSQIIYFTDIINFKIVSDLIMSIPSFFFLSLERFNTFTLIFTEISIFLYIFIFANENFVIDNENKVGKINKHIKFLFCFRKIDFHFGEKQNYIIFDELRFNDSDEEESILNDISMSVIKNIENIFIDFNEKGGDGSILGLNNTNTFRSLDTFSEIKNKKLDFKNISDFYLIQKLMMLYYIRNKGIYESANDKMDENFLEIKKINLERKSKRKSLNISMKRDSIISNIDRLSRISIKDIGKIKPSLRIVHNDAFTSIEEKELFEELKNKLNIKNEKYMYKIESLLSSELFEIFPFFQMKINTILKSLNPARNIKIFNKFIKRNNNTQNHFNISNKDDRISIKSLKTNNFNNNDFNLNLSINDNKKELEKNLYYTHDLYLMYEIYDKKDFVNFNELENIINEYNKYLLSVVKNMNYTFLPLILGIFNLEIYDSNLIIILYRNPLFFTNFNHFNHWINFYITEEPEKIKVSSLFNDVIDVNEIEIKNTLVLNEADYEEIKQNLENDYSFLIKINNIYPIIHLFIGDENDVRVENEEEEQKLKKNQCLENSILGLSINDDIGIYDVLDNNISLSFINNKEENDEIDENSLFDKEYYYMSGTDLRTIKIYFTNLFREDCELNKNQKNENNKVNSDSYCKYLQDQLINYLTKKSLFNDEDKDNV